MGDPAEKLDTNLDPEVVIVEDEIIEPGEEISNEETPSEENDTDEVEVVIEDEGSQPLQVQDGQQGIRKRINKLNKKVEQAEQGKTQAEIDLDIARENNRLQALQIEQLRAQPQPLTPPNPDDFDAGEFDPAYKQRETEYRNELTRQQVAQAVAESQQNTASQKEAAEKAQRLEAQQIAHYSRVKDIKVQNYEEHEDRVITALGTDAVNVIIENFDDAHLLFYYLGGDKPQNVEAVNSLATLIKTQPIKALAEIGRLSSKIKIKPRSSTAPTPPEKLEGGSKSFEDSGLSGVTFS